MPPNDPGKVLTALTKRRFLVTSWPWRSLAYLLTTIPVAVTAMTGLLFLLLPWWAAATKIIKGRSIPPSMVFLLVVSVGLAAIFGPILSTGWAALERWRLSLVDRTHIVDRTRLSARTPAYPSHPATPTGWLRRTYASGAAWRAVAYMAFLATIVPLAYGVLAVLLLLELSLLLSPWLAGHHTGQVALGVVQITSSRQAIPYALLGLVLLPLLPYLVGLCAAGQSAFARALLCGADDAVREVARSRARLVDSYETQRRRIERDLHDDTQHRLTSLALHLGMARLDVPDDSPAAVPLAHAHEQAKELMVVLRNIIHGIHPQSLTELGLLDALRELAARQPIPVTVTVPAPPRGPAATSPPGPDTAPGHGPDTPPWAGRLADRVESTGYFVVSEALANIARHSGATRAEVTLTHTGHLLILEIRDDGQGGADPARGSGLTGLADRVAALNGRLWLASPIGGPTLVRVELPCDQ